MARRSAWRQAIQRNDVREIAAAFVEGGVPAPDLVWSPQSSDCKASPCSFLLEHWRSIAPSSAMPPVAAIDPVALKKILGFVHLLEPVADAANFRYSIFGRAAASVSGFDMSGRLMTEFDASDYVVDFGIACSAAAVDRGMPLLTRRTPRYATEIKIWERLVLPFADVDGRAARLLVGIIPIGENGLVIQPQH